jgi:hypothetical protein
MRKANKALLIVSAALAAVIVLLTIIGIFLAVPKKSKQSKSPLQRALPREGRERASGQPTQSADPVILLEDVANHKEAAG